MVIPSPVKDFDRVLTRFAPLRNANHQRIEKSRIDFFSFRATSVIFQVAVSLCVGRPEKTRISYGRISSKEPLKELKRAITAALVLIPYDPARETLVICDVSPTGLGGSLFQTTNRFTT